MFDGDRKDSFCGKTPIKSIRNYWARCIYVMNRVSISSIDDSRLDVFRNLKQTNACRQQDLFVAEGTTLVERLLQSSYEVTAVLASEQKLANFAARVPEGTTVYEVPRDLASELVGYKFHLGVIAAARRKPAPSLADVVGNIDSGLVLFGEQIIDQQNVGMLIRIGSAFGAKAIVLSRGSADAFSRRVLRVSMGNGLFVPVVESVDAAESLASLKNAGFHCCATVLDDTAVELSNHSFAEKTAIVFGNETHGLSSAVREHCDVRLTIKMLNGTDSVNVAVAAGIFGHAYTSQMSPKL